MLSNHYFMNRNHWHYDVWRWYDMYGNWEVFSKIPWYQGQDTVIEENGTNPLYFLKELKIEKNMQCGLGEKKRVLFLANLKDVQICQKILTWLIEVFPEVQYLKLCNALITCGDHKIYSLKKMRYLSFNSCHLGNLASKKLSKISSENLRYLTLMSDCISNLGFKRLIKWFPSQLSILGLSNTNISPDCIKLFRKNIKPALNQVKIPDYNMNFQVFKEITHLRVRSIPDQPQIFKVRGLMINNNDYAFIANACKIELREGLTAQVKVMGLNKDDKNIAYRCLIPQTLIDIMKHFLQVY